MQELPRCVPNLFISKAFVFRCLGSCCAFGDETGTSSIMKEWRFNGHHRSSVANALCTPRDRDVACSRDVPPRQRPPAIVGPIGCRTFAHPRPRCPRVIHLGLVPDRDYTHQRSTRASASRPRRSPEAERRGPSTLRTRATPFPPVSRGLAGGNDFSPSRSSRTLPPSASLRKSRRGRPAPTLYPSDRAGAGPAR